MSDLISYIPHWPRARNTCFRSFIRSFIRSFRSLLEWGLVLGALFRIYSYLYHLILALFLFGIATVAIVSHLQAHPSEGKGSLTLGMLPWKGHTLVHWILGAAVFGLVSIVLAWRGKLRFL